MLKIQVFCATSGMKRCQGLILSFHSHTWSVLCGCIPDSVFESQHEREAGHLVPLSLGPVEVHHSASNGDVPIAQGHRLRLAMTD